MELFVRTAVRARADDCRWSELGARLEKRVKCAQVGAAQHPRVLCAGVTSTWAPARAGRSLVAPGRGEGL